MNNLKLEKQSTLPSFSRQPFLTYASGDGKVNPCLLFYFYLNGDSENRKERLENFFLPNLELSALGHFRNRQRAAIREFREHGAVTKCGKLKLTDRLLVGQGIASDFENGILLHWIHGFPYISGRTLKGAARAWAWEKKKHQDEMDTFKVIFGSFEKEKTDPDALSRGSVTFFDALPEEDDGLFDLDIINTHYGDYYTGEPPDLPADWVDPNPVILLTVAKEISFRFFLAGEEQATVDTAWQWLTNALKTRGVGAGKRSGYGHFMPAGECP